MKHNDLYRLEVVNNVLYVRLSGIWPKQIVKAVFEDVKELVEPIKAHPWAAYVDMRNWIMPTMEAMEDFQLIYDWCEQNNQTHEATVYQFAMQERIIRDSSSYQPEFQMYTKDPKEAVSWLSQKGFVFNLPE